MEEDQQMMFSHTFVHRVLGIPELLDMVFSYLGDRSNATNATVCKQWAEVALDKLWSDVDDLYRLFGLLSPLQRTVNGTYVFARVPDSSDWSRFEKYSRRVRCLRYNVAESKRELDLRAFDDIARTRTSLSILPSMRTLHWDANLPLCVMFMHSSIKTFVVHLPDVMDTETVFAPFIHDVVARMPALQDLDVRANVAMNAIEDTMILLFDRTKRLKKLTLPRFDLTTKIAEALARLEELGTIEFQYHVEQGRGDPGDIRSFRPCLTEGAFPALWDLSMTVQFEDAARFMSGTFAPANITMLYIDSSQDIEKPSGVHNLLTILSQHCRLLKSLSLVSLCDTVFDDEQITLDTLKPLFNCPALLCFELIHQLPVNLQQEDIEELAQSWPSLETLLLNCEPIHLGNSSLSLRALLPFSQHCPNIQRLGLFVNAITDDLPKLFQSGQPSPYQPFKKLQRLSMGVSIIHDEGAVALFLSQLCPLQCSLESGVTWEDGVMVGQAVFDVIQDRCLRWDKVAEVLPLLTKLRLEEAERTKSLQLEVDDLRMRTGVLMGKETMKSGDSCTIV